MKRTVEQSILMKRARRQNPVQPIKLISSLRPRTIEPPLTVASCIGCGCTDLRACLDALFGEPCFWIKVDRKLQIGVCSSCEHKLEEYEKRVRSLESGVRSEEVSNLEKMCAGSEAVE